VTFAWLPSIITGGVNFGAEVQVAHGIPRSILLEATCAVNKPLQHKIKKIINDLAEDVLDRIMRSEFKYEYS